MKKKLLVKSGKLKMHKLTVMMNLLIFMLFGSIFTVQAQGLQKITLNVKDVPAKTVFKEIEKQTGYVFFYRDDLKAVEKTIDFVANDQDVKVVLDNLLNKKLNVDFKIEGKQVYLSEKESQKSTQTKLLKGIVTDAATGESLPGVNILVKGTAVGTTSDFEGMYALNDVPLNSTIQFSFIGYQQQEVTFVGEEISIKLAVDAKDIDEVIVIGYGQVQNKRTVSTAVSKISSSSIEALPVSRPESVLQGSTAGVTVAQNSGSPGAPLTIRLRGVGTAGEAQPLFLVDGVQVPNLDYLNTSDIADISILKDASASAIYGSRGGNGVILVQTKKGKRNSDQPTVSFDGYYGFQNLANTPDLMNRDQYVSYYNAYASANGLTTISDAERAQLPDTDWYDEVFDDNVPIQNYNVSIANGGDKYSYYLSGGWFDQEGMVGGDRGKSDYNRKNVKFNFDTDLMDNLKINVGIDLVRTERNFLDENFAGTGSAVLNYIPALPAIYPAFDAEGLPYDMGQFGTGVINGITMPFSGVGAVTNPYVALSHNNNEMVSDMRMLNVGANWKIKENLIFNTSYAYFEERSLQRNFIQQYDYRYAGHELYNETNDYTETDYRNWYSQWEGNLTYTFKNLGEDHDLDVMGGFSVLESYSRVKGQSGSDFFLNDFDDVNFALIKDASAITNLKPSEIESGLLSFYGRAKYNYKNKYLFTTTIRSDGSSRFGDDRRWGLFPSFSAGWVLSEEDFLADSDVFDLLKLRASWGVNGNDNIKDYQHNPFFNTRTGPSFGGNNTVGISTEFLPNPFVQWEEVSQTNIGLDINAFNNTLGITLDYYKKKTSDMLVPIGTPVYIGKQSAAANIADVENEGLEFLVSYKKTYSSGFKWNATFNIGYNKNEVTSLGSNGQPLDRGNIGFIFPDPITRTDIGEPIASFYGYEVDRIDSEGELIFKDLDGDGKDGVTDKTYIGNPFPDFTYGINLSASYKGFDLNAFLYGSQGNDIYDATVRLDAPYSNRPVSYGQEGAPANLLGGATGTDQTRVSDFYVKDGSFAKLKTLTLGYSLPKATVESMGLSKVRFYVTGQNLFTITDYDGVDPEIGQANAQSVLDVGIDRGFYPQPRTILFGFQIRY
ncbi:SusC/RagA family TonB-linked outer membrane protein [Marinifilum sp.]|uniref:SusC/RagA family TonB-linked outer membrane protein n=1 Tax=Marinifilum sp. TaxID=2033137 RepID=UPI003BABBDF1